jgi:hypothetical protein
MSKQALMPGALTISAKVAPACVRTPGLFQLSSSCTPEQKLDAHRELDGLVFHFRGDRQLTEDDLAVLLVVLALAGSQNDTFKSVRQYTGEKELRALKMLSRKVEVKTSYSALLRELGKSNNGDTWWQLTDSLARLFAVSATLQPQGAMPSSRFYPQHLMGELDVDRGRDRVSVSLCPILAAGLLGGPGEFVQIRLDDFRALRDKSGAAQLLYFHLHHFPAGRPCSVTEDYCLRRVYGEDFGVGSTLSMRRKRLKDAFARVAKLSGWSVKEAKAGYVVGRPGSRRSY